MFPGSVKAFDLFTFSWGFFAAVWVLMETDGPYIVPFLSLLLFPDGPLFVSLSNTTAQRINNNFTLVLTIPTTTTTTSFNSPQKHKQHYFQCLIWSLKTNLNSRLNLSVSTLKDLAVWFHRKWNVHSNSPHRTGTLIYILFLLWNLIMAGNKTFTSDIDDVDDML